MLEEIKKAVCKANIDLVKQGIVVYTWGNVSQRDPKTNYMVIKPSGVDYETMQPEDMVVVDIKTGEKIEGKYNPSSDTKTHLEIYRAFEEVNGIAHTHSINATAYAQAGEKVEAIGTTHADVFHGPVLCTRCLTKREVEQDYETNTGKVIVKEVQASKKEPLEVPAILVANHGPFTWGKNADGAVYNAVCLEKICEMNLKAFMINKNASMPTYILDKHYFRKHGKNAYYGQEQKK